MRFSPKIWSCIVLQPNMGRACRGEDQKQNRVDVSKKTIDPAKADENLLRNKPLQYQQMYSSTITYGAPT